MIYHRFILILGASAVCLLSGCTSTRLETPLGTYYSTRDSALESLVIEIIETPDGGKTTRVVVGGARGDASPVIQAQTDLVRAAMEAAFELGKAVP